MRSVYILALFVLTGCAGAPVVQYATPEEAEAFAQGERVCLKIARAPDCFNDISRPDYSAAYIKSGADLLECALDYVYIKKARLMRQMMDNRYRADSVEKRQRDAELAVSLADLAGSLAKVLIR